MEECDIPYRWRTSNSSTGRCDSTRQERETVIECRSKYSSPSMVENMSKDVCGLVRCFRIYQRQKAKIEITTESPLLPWLVRHSGWILSRYAVRADGRTRYSRLQGREYTAGIAKFGEAIWYKVPKTADLTKLDDRWRTAIWLGKSDRSDEHIIGLETGAVLARSVRRKVEGKCWNERVLKMVTGTPWNPRPGEVVVSRRYVTRALVERYSPTEDCGACFRKSQQHWHDSSSCANKRMGQLRSRAQEGQPTPPDPAALNLVSTSTAARTGGVAMETEDTEQAVSGQAPATAAPVRPFFARNEERQWSRRGEKVNVLLPVFLCVLC